MINENLAITENEALKILVESGFFDIHCAAWQVPQQIIKRVSEKYPPIKDEVDRGIQELKNLSKDYNEKSYKIIKEIIEPLKDERIREKRLAYVLFSLNMHSLKGKRGKLEHLINTLENFVSREADQEYVSRMESKVAMIYFKDEKELKANGWNIDSWLEACREDRKERMIGILEDTLQEIKEDSPNQIIKNLINSIEKPRILEFSDIKQAFKIALAQFSGEFVGKKTLDFKISYSPNCEDLCLCTNPEIFCNVISELAENAYKNREIRVSPKFNVDISKNDSYIKFRCKDNGVGISEEDIKHVFEYGFTRTKGGTGMGLAVTKDLVEVFLNGKIAIESKVGEGTTISLQIPYQV